MDRRFGREHEVGRRGLVGGVVVCATVRRRMSVDAVPAAPDRPWVGSGAYVLGGIGAVLLGVLAELAGYLPGSWQYLSQVIYPWLLGAFAVGVAARNAPRAAAAGAGFLLAALLANTVVLGLLGGHTALRPILEQEWPAWVALALVVGGCYGVTGWLRTAGSPMVSALAVAVVLASGLAEVVANLTGLLAWGPVAAVVVAALVALSAVVLGKSMGRRQRVVGAAATVVLTTAALLALPVLAALIPVV